MDKHEKYEQLEAKLTELERIVREALMNTDYVDWFTLKEEGRYESRVARDIQSALRAAHEDRLLAARSALTQIVTVIDAAAWEEVISDYE
jgi:uncharacterized membrane protein